MKRARPKEAANIPDETKTAIAALYITQHALGIKRNIFVSHWAASGFFFSERQLDRWVAAYKSCGTAISTTKLTGPEVKLSRGQRDICAGYVLHCIDTGKIVHLETYCSFVADQFAIIIHPMTASNYLNEDGFSYRVIHKKTSGFTVDIEKIRKAFWKWRQSQNFDMPLEHLGSMDFTYTGHRTERASGFGVRGGAQPMQSSSISKYTNCIITLIWAHGINKTASMLFTYNPAFRTDRNPTKRRKPVTRNS